MIHKLRYFVNGGSRIFTLEGDEIRVGKLKDMDICLEDATVSRQHCRLVYSRKGWEIFDSDSTNGTFVNGRRIQRKLLKPGDEIAIGRARMRYLVESTPHQYQDNSDQKISMVLPLRESFEIHEQDNLKRELGHLAELTELGRHLIAASCLPDCFEHVGSAIFNILKPQRLFIFFHDDIRGELDLRYSRDAAGNPVETVTISRTIAMKAMEEKVAILSSDTKGDKRFEKAESVILYGIVSAVSIPIWTKRSIYGLIYVDTTQLTELFSQRDLEVLSTIANFTGLTIESIQSQQSLDREMKLRSRLERYHSPAVVSRIMQDQESGTREIMAYRETEATVLFMDMVGFTSRAENMKPVEVGLLLNHFFTAMTEIIFSHNGTLDKYIGDGIMAVFGAPLAVEDHSRQAVGAALEMVNQLHEINRDFTPDDPIQVRIGIHTGRLISGDFGSPKRYDYTVLGTTVNIASRLESAVAGPNEVVVSEAVYLKLRKQFAFQKLGEFKLQGISSPVTSFKVKRLKGES